MAARIPLPSPLSGGPFTSRQGYALGLSPSRLAGSDLVRPFHGVRTAESSLSLEARCAAFQLRMPADAYFCSVTAALLLGVPLPPRLELGPELHVAVPAPRRALKAAGIIGHKLQTSDSDVWSWAGLRIASPEFTWCELGAALSVPDLVAAGDYLIHWRTPLTTQERLEAAITTMRKRRGSVALREAITLLNGRSESRPESLVRVMLERAGLTEYAVNLPITTSDGTHYRADLAFVREKLAIEYQGDHHRGVEQFRWDMTRTSRLQADGWFVMQLNADDLYEPSELLTRIRRVLAARRRARG